METLDIFILVPLLAGLVLGYIKGFLKEVVSFLSLVIGIYFGIKMIDLGVEFLSGFIPQAGKAIFFISFLIIFFGIVIGLRILATITKSILDKTILGIFDKLAGALLGLLKWGFAVAIVFALERFVNIISPEAKEASILYSPFFEISLFILQKATFAFHNYFG